jgi:uncharacterized protein
LKSIKFKIPARYNGKYIVGEVCVQATFKFQPLIIFAHGLNGFKDWGPFPAMGDAFARAGFAFCRFNFSHNGTTALAPSEISDLDAYQKNTLGIQRSDVRTLLAYFEGGKAASEGILVDKKQIGLLGHSWGGGICILEAAQNATIKAMATLAAPAVFGQNWTPELRKAWAMKGYHTLINSRTGQELRLGYPLLQELESNPDALSPLLAATQLTQPWLIVHGEADETVSLSDALELNLAQPSAQSLFVPNSGHTYGEMHPPQPALGPAFTQVIETTIRFFRSAL